MNDYRFDVSKSEYAYLFGLIQTDGHMYQGKGGKGHVVIELSERDADIFEQIAPLLPYHIGIYRRDGKTNFSKMQISIVWKISDRRFREELFDLGMPYGKKSSIIAPPRSEYSQVDYFRGIIDGDGSLGVTAENKPFVSLVTASETLAEAYIAFLEQITGFKRVVNRNKRDGVFNIVVYIEGAIALAKTLYTKDCIAIERKKSLALQMQLWARPESMRKVTFEKRDWTSEEDAYILSHSQHESAQALERTWKSVNARLWRLQRDSNK